MPPWARVHAPTALYEKIVTTAVSTSGVFGEIVAVVGASGPVTISTPNFTSPAQNPKMCFDFAVVNADGSPVADFPGLTRDPAEFVAFLKRAKS